MNKRYLDIGREIEEIDWLILNFPENLQTNKERGKIYIGNEDNETTYEKIAVLKELKRDGIVSYQSFESEEIEEGQIWQTNTPKTKTGIFYQTVLLKNSLDELRRGKEKLLLERTWHGENAYSCQCGKLRLYGRTARFDGTEFKLGEKEAKLLRLLLEKRRLSFSEFAKAMYPKGKLGPVTAGEKFRELLQVIKEKLHIRTKDVKGKEIFKPWKKDGYILTC